MPQKSACISCHAKKRRCDGQTPACKSCLRLSLDCQYPSFTRKRGPKRAHLETCSAKITQIEQIIKQSVRNKSTESRTECPESLHLPPSIKESVTNHDESNLCPRGISILSDQCGQQLGPPECENDWVPHFPTAVQSFETGLSQSSITELHRVFFRDVHPTIPILHPSRYLERQHNIREPRDDGFRCLRYIVWSLATSLCEEFSHMKNEFYEQARKYAYDNELNGKRGLSITQCQALILISYYEHKYAHFPQAWLTAGKAIRLAQVLKLHRLDNGSHWNFLLAPPTDWIELEERRRVFWSAYCLDIYSDIGGGLSTMIDERDISTHLPSEEESFEGDEPNNVSYTLVTAFQSNMFQNLSPFGSVVVLALLAAQTANHLRNNDESLHDDQKYWENHYAVDRLLLQFGLFLPDHLKVPVGIRQPNAVFINMLLHALTISLHHAAVARAGNDPLKKHLKWESNMRCLTSASEIANIMRQVAEANLAAIHVLIPYCIFVALRYLMTPPQSGAPDHKETCQSLIEALNSCVIRQDSFLAGLFLHARILQLKERVVNSHNCEYIQAPKYNKNSSGCLVLTGGICRSFQKSLEGNCQDQSMSYSPQRAPVPE